MRLQLPCRGPRLIGHLPWHTSLSLLLFSSCICWSSLEGRKYSTSKARMEQCFTLATSFYLPEGEVRKNDPSQPSLRQREIVRARIAQISLIQCSRKFSDLLCQVGSVCKPLHLSDDRRTDDHGISVSLHVPHLLDCRDAKANRDRKRRELPHTLHQFFCFRTYFLARSGHTRSRDGVDKSACVFRDELQAFVGGSRRYEEDHIQIVSA